MGEGREMKNKRIREEEGEGEERKQGEEHSQ